MILLYLNQLSCNLSNFYNELLHTFLRAKYYNKMAKPDGINTISLKKNQWDQIEKLHLTSACLVYLIS